MSLEKLQQRTINVLGPLTKVWDCLDSANNCSDEEVNINLPEITEDLEKAILLLGQANNAIAYQRRLFVLNSITKEAKKAKIQLKERADMLAREETRLFGKEFQTFLTETAKSRLKSREIRQVLNEEKHQPFDWALHFTTTTTEWWRAKSQLYQVVKCAVQFKEPAKLG